MDLKCVLIFILSMAIESIIGKFWTQDIAVNIKEILYTGEESSLLQCAQRCRFIDKTSAAKFHDSICQCVKYKENANNGNTTLTGFFTIKVVPKSKPKRLENVSIMKPSSQSSTHSHSAKAAHLGNDGNLGTASLTEDSPNQWWRVDFERIIVIEYILFDAPATLYNRNKDLVIETRKEANGVWQYCQSIIEKPTRVTTKYSCVKTTSARYLKVQSTAKCVVSIYELHVYTYA